MAIQPIEADRRKGASRRGARTAGLVAIFTAVALAIGGAYAVYAINRIEYFVARDLRGLSTLSAQLESEIARRQDVLRIFARLQTPMKEPKPRMFLELERLRERETIPGEAAKPPDSYEQELLTTGVRPRLTLRHTTADTKKTVEGDVDVERVVRPLFAQSFLSIFDVVLLATPEGKVLYQTGTAQVPPLPIAFGSNGNGRRRLHSALVVTDLGGLQQHSGFREWTALKPRDLHGVSRRTTVRITGREYYLFTQPVQLVSSAPLPPTPRDAAKDAPKPSPRPGSGEAELLIGALVPVRTFRLQAWAIPDTILAIALGLMILLLCCYPFLRIALLPNRAPLTPVGVVLATLAALLGSAVLAIMIGNTVIYRQLRTLENEQLEKYAHKLRNDLQTNILRSVRLATAIRNWAVTRQKAQNFQPEIHHLERAVDRKDRDIWQNPYFTGFLWLDRQGMAVATGATNGQAPPLTKMDHLRWFREANEERWWRIGERFAGQDTWRNVVIDVSRAHVDAETTVAVPVVAANGEVTGIFGVTVPLIHFVEPVVPPGFGFAVIDERGTVLFHSEKPRALSENLFEETDGDRHLRAVVHARRDDMVSGRYWGIGHQMFVAPVPATPWTVVAMRDESVLRTINTEAIAMTALLVALYAALYACIFVALAILRPDYRAPWLWPDRKRRCEYAVALGALALECVALTATVITMAHRDLMAVGFIAPVRGLATAYLVVNRHERNWQWITGMAGSSLFTLFWGVLVARGELDPVVTERLLPVTIRVLLLVLVVVPYARSWGAASWHLEGSIAVTAAMVIVLAADHASDDRGEVVSLLVVAALYVSSAAIGKTWRLWRPPRAVDAPTMKLYQWVGVGMLVVSAVLPAIAFLKTAMRVGVDARVKQAQLRLADMLEKRLNLLERLNVRVYGDDHPRGIAGQRVASDCAVIDHAFSSAWTLVPHSTVEYSKAYQAPSRRRNLPERREILDGCCRDSALRAAWIPDVIDWMLPRYSEGSVATRDLHHDTASDRTWQWWRGPRHFTLRRTVMLDERTLDRLYPDRTQSEPVDLLIRSAVPQPMLFDRLFAGEQNKSSSLDEVNCPKDADVDVGTPILGANVPFDPPRGGTTLPLRALIQFSLALIAFLFAARIPWQAVGFLGKRVFLFDETPPWMPDQLPIRSGIGMHLFLERRKGTPRKDIVAEETFHPIDILPACNGGQKWSELIASVDNAPEDKDLLIIGFDEALETREFSFGVPMFLEELLEGQRHTLVVVANASPQSIIATQSGDVRRRWQNILDQFTRIDACTLEKKPVPEHFDEHSRRHFERMWSDSSPDERLMLYQIARDGLANGKDRNTLRRLFARKLVRCSPHLDLVTPGLEQFVHMAARREAVTKAEKVPPQPRWQSLTIAGVVVVGASLAVLLTTQKEVINLTTGIITALAAGIPAVLRLVAALQGKTSADTS